MAALRLPGSLADDMRAALRSVQRWDLWAVQEPLRSYLLLVPLLAVLAGAAAGADTQWSSRQVFIFAALLGCAVITVEATRSVKEVHGALSRDLQTVWYLAIATSCPPVFAFAAPIPLTVYKLWRMPRGLTYRRVFSNATLSLGYGCASLVFHSLGRPTKSLIPTTGTHVIVWAAIVALCGVIGWLVNHLLLVGAIKMSDSKARIQDFLATRESVTSDLVELSLAVSVALLVAINPLLMALALPSVILYRRHLMQAQLVAQARIDAKTGLLNAPTWRREAEVEFIRAVRVRSPLTLLLLGIDHFESVRDTAGRQAGDQVIKAIAGILTSELGGFDLIGRFGAERFAILMPQAGADDARRLAERLRDHIAGEPFPIEDGSHAGFVFRLTVSIGIGALDTSQHSLEALMADAEGALAMAHDMGYNRVCALDPAEADEA